MEDLAISPWQIQEENSSANFYNKCKKSTSKFDVRLSIKTRFIHTESEENHQSLNIKKDFNIAVFRKKGQSSSTHQNFYQRKISRLHSKLQIKLVPYPIRQRLKQRQIVQRFSEKIQNNHSQNVDDIQKQFSNGIDNEIKKKTTIVKQKHLINQILSNTTNFNRKSQLNKERILKNQLPQTQSSKKFSMKINSQKIQMILPIHQQKENKNRSHQFSQNKQNFLQKKPLFRNRYEGYFNLKHASHQQTNQSCYYSKIPLSQFKNESKHMKNKIKQHIQLSNQYKKSTNQIQKQNQEYKKVQKTGNTRIDRKTIQKLQNIDCFQDNTNVLLDIKQKNKVLFNQLQKYNLFGLRNFTKKSLKKK